MKTLLLPFTCPFDSPAMLKLISLCAFALFPQLMLAQGGGHFTCPKDESVLDAKRDFGAKGDGTADDTEALQRAIEASCGSDKAHRGKTNALFLPNGTYRVTKSLVVKAALGPWLYGESRDGVVIKLDDGVKDVTCVLRTHPNEKGPTSADWFMRNLRNFTVDVGNNPETDGIRYYATNSGILKNVRAFTEMQARENLANPRVSLWLTGMRETIELREQERA